MLANICSQCQPFQYWLLLQIKEIQMKVPALVTINKSPIFTAL